MGFTSETHAAAHYRTKYRSRWAMNHCREKARHLLLNMQWVTGAPMNICAQAEAARERRAAWARSHRSNPAAGVTAMGVTARGWAADKPRLRGTTLPLTHFGCTLHDSAPHAHAPAPPPGLAHMCVFRLFVLCCISLLN